MVEKKEIKRQARKEFANRVRRMQEYRASSVSAPSNLLEEAEKLPMASEKSIEIYLSLDPTKLTSEQVAKISDELIKRAEAFNSSHPEHSKLKVFNNPEALEKWNFYTGFRDLGKNPQYASRENEWYELGYHGHISARDLLGKNPQRKELLDMARSSSQKHVDSKQKPAFLYEAAMLYAKAGEIDKAKEEMNAAVNYAKNEVKFLSERIAEGKEDLERALVAERNWANRETSSDDWDWSDISSANIDMPTRRGDEYSDHLKSSVDTNKKELALYEGDLYKAEQGLKYLEKIASLSNRHLPRHERDLSSKLTPVLASVALLSGIFFFSTKLTGNVVGVSAQTSSLIGVGLLIVGLISGFFWIKKRK